MPLLIPGQYWLPRSAALLRLTGKYGLKFFNISLRVDLLFCMHVQELHSLVQKKVTWLRLFCSTWLAVLFCLVSIMYKNYARKFIHNKKL